MSDTNRWKQSDRCLTMGSRQLESVWQWAVVGRLVVPGFGGTSSGDAVELSIGAGAGADASPCGEGLSKLFSRVPLKQDRNKCR